MVTGGSEIITITLDGLTVSGFSGMTILELARESGIEIPTLCSDPHLEPTGACRICLVQDERNGNVFASCVTPIAQGMILNTNSEAVSEHRRYIIELMLASHPDICMVCDKGNRCHLRQIASKMGIGLTKLYKVPQFMTIQEINPFIERDLTKCILCGKCIRACNEMVVEGAIDYYQRGFSTKPSTFKDLPLESSECTFCGTCLPLCPTGALSERIKHYRGSASISVDTTCPFCACGCSLNIETKNDCIIRVKPSDNESVNNGTACIWGSYGLDFINSHERLTKPLIKDNDNYQQSSWENALNIVAKKFQEIKEKYGPDSFTILGSPNCTNEDNYILQKFARTAIGTNNIDSLSNYFPPGLDPFRSVIAGKMSQIKDIDSADLIILICTDPEKTAPIISYQIKRAVKFNKAKLITINNMETRLVAFSSIWLQYKTGTETILLKGIIGNILENSSIKHNTLAETYPDYREIEGALIGYPIQKAAEITDIEVEQIKETAKLIASSTNTIVIFDIPGYQVHPNELTNTVEHLISVTNIVSKKTCKYIFPYKFCNSLGMNDMGISPYHLPGYQSINDTSISNKFNIYWNISLPLNHGREIMELMLKSNNDTAIAIKCIYMFGQSPFFSSPENSLTHPLLKDLEFMVLQDMFLTETARMADVILPVAGFIEKEGTFTNLEGRVQKINKFINPVGESLPDWEIVQRISQKMGSVMDYKSTKSIDEEISTLVPLYHNIIDLAENKTWSIDTIQFRNKYFKHYQREIADYRSQNNSQKKDRKNDYPFVLMVDPELNFFGTGTRTSRATRFSNQYPGILTIEINEYAAKQLSIQDNEKVNLESPHNTMPAIISLNNEVADGLAIARNITSNEILKSVLNTQINTFNKAIYNDHTLKINISKVD